MKVAGTAVLHADRERVWAALTDPAVLVRTIPGCSQLETVGEDAYRMTVTAGVASIKGAYDGEVRLTDQAPPDSFVLRASGSGAPGTVSADVRVTLAERDGETDLSYDADAVVGGMIGGVGQRMLAGVAKKTAGEFFKAVDGVLTGATPAEPVPVGAGAAPQAEQGVPAGTSAPAAAAQAPGVFRPPAPAAASAAAGGPEWWMLLAAFGAGAFWALAGVVIGSRIARRGPAA